MKTIEKTKKEFNQVISHSKLPIIVAVDEYKRLEYERLWKFTKQVINEVIKRERKKVIEEIKDIPRFQITYPDGTKSNVILEHSLKTHGFIK